MSVPSSKEIFDLVNKAALEIGVDPDLAQAICAVESSGDPLAIRFEKAWKYFERPEDFARANHITIETEKTLQACSWGPLQVMGAVCRELGMKGSLLLLAQPEHSIKWGVIKLKKVCEKYEEELFAISAYNCGTPKKKDGKFANQEYVDKVLKKLLPLRAIGD